MNASVVHSILKDNRFLYDSRRKKAGERGFRSYQLGIMIKVSVRSFVASIFFLLPYSECKEVFPR